MKKILGYIHPTFGEQKIFILENEKTIDQEFSIKTIDFATDIVKLANANYVTDIELAGHKEYVQGVIQCIKQEELNQYNHNTLNITWRNK